MEDVFLDDCNHEGKFLEKTHYPSVHPDSSTAFLSVDAASGLWLTVWQCACLYRHLRDGGGWDRYARAVRPIRNPLDATYVRFSLY